MRRTGIIVRETGIIVRETGIIVRCLHVEDNDAQCVGVVSKYMCRYMDIIIQPLSSIQLFLVRQRKQTKALHLHPCTNQQHHCLCYHYNTPP